MSADRETMSGNRFAGCETAEVWLSGLASWNIATFGPGLRTKGVTDHIARELDEIRKAPTDLAEWADVILLALAGAVRAATSEGLDPGRVIDAVRDKHQRNLQRKWPDWRTADPEKAIEHVHDTDPAPVPPAPVVELDADQLDALARNIKAWSELAIILNVDDTCELPIGCGRIAYSESSGAWVLRIGGDQ